MVKNIDDLVKSDYTLNWEVLLWQKKMKRLW